MKNISINNFSIKLNKDNILHTLGCFENSSIYNTVSGYFDELEKIVSDIISPRAVAAIENKTAYCLITLGSDISDYSKSLFDSGEGMRGLLCEAMADEYVFEIDKQLSERIKHECAIWGYGVKKRLDAPDDFPLSKQKVILSKTDTFDVTLTSGFMFSPAKTLGYILEFTEDKTVFNTQHDCSKCSNFSCPRRNTTKNENFEILSEYEYAPHIADGESVVCIDIGTTTVVFELLISKGTVKTHKTTNPQRRFGLDVLSRIEAAVRGRSEELSSLIRYTLIDGYNKVTANHRDIKAVIISGNTTMVHLLMGYPCKSLGEYPFTSDFLDTISSTFDKVTHVSNVPPVKTVILGGISAFVGGDITSGLYMCDFDKSDKVNLFIDLGTNGEMAIGDSKSILVTSTAAGPAFEGGRISCGTGSIDGAVYSVDINTGTLKTIGSSHPIGLCGTGIIELLAELIDNNIIDRTGLLCDKYFSGGYKVTDKIIFTQNDIREVQVAKSAIRAGIEILIKEYGVNINDIGTVYLAGGFGQRLSTEKACKIGLIPKELEDKVKIIGNSSLGGCVKFASSTDGEERIKHIKEISKEISLADSDSFNEAYIKYMNF